MSIRYLIAAALLLSASSALANHDAAPSAVPGFARAQLLPAVSNGHDDHQATRSHDDDDADDHSRTAQAPRPQLVQSVEGDDDHGSNYELNEESEHAQVRSR